MGEELSGGGKRVKLSDEKEMIPKSALQPSRALLEAQSGLERTVRLLCWNVNGLKSVVEKRREDLLHVIDAHKADVVFLSETKLQSDLVARYTGLLPGFTSYFACSQTKKGYSGVAMFVRNDIPVKKVGYDLGSFLQDGEGRTISIEFDDFCFVGSYVPNAGQKLERLDYRVDQFDVAMRSYLEHLTQSTGNKPVVLGGDLNCAHRDLDVWNYKASHLKKQAGCTARERDSFSLMLESQNRVDSFRDLYPEASGHYTFWSTRAGNRAPNRGMRLDYFIIPQSMFQEASPVKCHNSFCVEDPPNLSDHGPACLDVIVPLS